MGNTLKLSMLKRKLSLIKKNLQMQNYSIPGLKNSVIMLKRNIQSSKPYWPGLALYLISAWLLKRILNLARLRRKFQVSLPMHSLSEHLLLILLVTSLNHIFWQNTRPVNLMNNGGILPPHPVINQPAVYQPFNQLPQVKPSSMRLDG